MVNNWIHRLTRRSALVVAGFTIAMAGSFVVGHVASAKTSKTIAVCNDPTDCANAKKDQGKGVIVVNIEGMSASQAANAVKTTANKTGATSVVTLGGTAAVSANYNKQIANNTGLTTVQLGGATGTQTANMLGSYLNGNTNTSSLYNLSKSGANRGTYTSTGNIYAGQGKTSNASGYYGDVGVSVYKPTTSHKKKKTTPQPTGCTSNCGTSTLHYTPPPGTSTQPSTTSTPPSTTSTPPPTTYTPPPVYYPPPPVWTTQYRTWTETSWGNGTSYNQAACAAQGGTSTGQAQGTITTYFTESWQVSNYGQSTAPATTSSSSFTPSDWQCKAVSGSPYWQPDGTTVSYPDRNLSAVCNADAVGTVNVTPTQKMQNWAYWWTQTGPSQSTTQAVSLGTTGQQYKYAVTAGTCPGGVVDTSVGTNNGQFVHLASALNANLLEPLKSTTSSTTVPESLGTVTWKFQQGTGSNDNSQGNGGGFFAEGGNPGNVSVPVVGTVSKTVPVTTTKTVQATCTVPHQETAYRTVDEAQTVPETQSYTYTVEVPQTQTGTRYVQQAYTATKQVPVTSRVYVNTSHYVTTRSYVSSGYWATGSRYVSSGYWASNGGRNVCAYMNDGGRWVRYCHWESYGQHWVNTSHYVSYRYYVNTSHYVTSQHYVNSGYWTTRTTEQTETYTAYRTVPQTYTYTVDVPETRTGTRTVYVTQYVPVQQAYTTTVLTEESCTKQEQVTTYQTVSATGVIMTSLGTAIAHNATYTVNGQTFTETTWTLT
ncbi:MAG: hypothetical protein C7B45_16400 [Sulfobacillus acidophilus]|uniref:Uncharacterized protein n=1 Tax=Sulfobacillus acidophilus TaxID=53633 RepID=A0A2T2WD32_9FIRM|nr:MAG: hypothetical protein C7B45_16400 [Sulfobacillus acidophilus]